VGTMGTARFFDEGGLRIDVAEKIGSGEAGSTESVLDLISRNGCDAVINVMGNGQDTIIHELEPNPIEATSQLKCLWLGVIGHCDEESKRRCTRCSRQRTYMFPNMARSSSQ
jgi:hypothetical protein